MILRSTLFIILLALMSAACQRVQDVSYAIPGKAMQLKTVRELRIDAPAGTMSPNPVAVAEGPDGLLWLACLLGKQTAIWIADSTGAINIVLAGTPPMSQSDCVQRKPGSFVWLTSLRIDEENYRVFAGESFCGRVHEFDRHGVPVDPQPPGFAGAEYSSVTSLALGDGVLLESGRDGDLPFSLRAYDYKGNPLWHYDWPVDRATPEEIADIYYLGKTAWLPARQVFRITVPPIDSVYTFNTEGHLVSRMPIPLRRFQPPKPKTYRFETPTRDKKWFASFTPVTQLECSRLGYTAVQVHVREPREYALMMWDENDRPLGQPFYTDDELCGVAADGSFIFSRSDTSDSANSSITLLFMVPK